MPIKYFSDDATKKHFAAKEGIVFNQNADSYILRITNKRNGTNSRVSLEEKLDDNWGKLIKASKAAHLGNGAINPQNENMMIVTFNIPDERIAYKAIFPNSEGNYSAKPIKIFSSVDEGKWAVITSPSRKLIKQCQIEMNRLNDFYWPKSNER